MANTQGFDVVAEVTVAMLKQVFQAAWKSGGNTFGGGVIPEYFDIPAGTSLGPYTLADSQVQIPQAELDLTMATDVNGVNLKFGLDLQIQLQNPPVPSLAMLTMTADCHVKAPVGTLPSSVNVGMLFANLPSANVTATLTSGDPNANLDTYITDYGHQMYTDQAIPNTIQQTNQYVQALSFNAYEVDVWVDLYDDLSDPAHQISVTFPPNQVTITIPIHMRTYNIRNLLVGLAPNLLDPMGVEAQMVLVAPLSVSAGTVTAKLSSATVTVPISSLIPASGTYAAQGPTEGPNYTANATTLSGYGVDLATTIQAQLVTQGQNMVATMSDISVAVPTAAQIEAAIANAMYQQLVPMGFVAIWTPATSASSPSQVNNVTTLALTDALVIAINAGGGANVNAITNFVPGGDSFAIALSASKVLSIINTSIQMPASQGGLGPNFPPKNFPNVNGHDANLTSLNVSLIAGAIHMEGNITIVDAIAWSIDVDTSFKEDVGLQWVNNSTGGQRMAAVAGQPQVDLSLLAWIVSFVIGFITLGLIGVVIALVVMLIVQNVAQSIGGDLITNSITNEVDGIGAFPSQLIQIGTVQSTFENPIGISTDGILMAG